MAHYLGGRWKQRARALRQCGRSAIRLSCQGCGQPTLIPYRCRARTCPHAARAGAAALAARMGQRVKLHDLVQETQEWDGHGRQAKRSWRMVTLTTRVAVGEGADKTWAAPILRFRVLRARRALIPWWRRTPWGRQIHGEKGKRSRRDTSAIAAVEVGAGGMVHLHVLVYGEFVSQEQLSRSWAKVLGVSMAIVDVRSITSMEEGLKEVLKYTVKGFQEDMPLTPQRAANLELAFRHVHRVSMLGALRRIRLEKDHAKFDDVRAEDVHDHQVAACEDCGCVGDWKWVGVADERTVKANGGYGLWRGIPPPLPAELLT